MSRLSLRVAWCQPSIRAVGWDVMRVRDPGLPDVWIASVDLWWWWCARLTYRCKPAQVLA